MNPPLSCRIVRRWAALVGAETSRVVTRHVAHCADCELHFAADHALENALRAEAPSAAAMPRADFDREIMSAVMASRPLPRNRAPARSSVNRGWFVLAGAAAAVALTFAVRTQWSADPGTTTGAPQHTAGTKVATAGDPAREAISWSTLAAPVQSLASNDPLQTEVDSVYADAQSAVRFLALNFLPSNDRNAGSPNFRPRGSRQGNG